MKELTSTQPTTDAEYEAEADRYLDAIRANLRAMNESQIRIEQMRAETDDTLANVRRMLDGMAAERTARETA